MTNVDANIVPSYTEKALMRPWVPIIRSPTITTVSYALSRSGICFANLPPTRSFLMEPKSPKIRNSSPEATISRSENHMEVSSRSVDDSTLDVSSITDAAVAMYLPREKLTTTNATRGIEYVSSITGMSQVPKAMELTERVADDRAMYSIVSPLVM